MDRIDECLLIVMGYWHFGIGTQEVNRKKNLTSSNKH